MNQIYAYVGGSPLGWYDVTARGPHQLDAMSDAAGRASNADNLKNAAPLGGALLIAGGEIVGPEVLAPLFKACSEENPCEKQLDADLAYCAAQSIMKYARSADLFDHCTAWAFKNFDNCETGVPWQPYVPLTSLGPVEEVGDGY